MKTINLNYDWKYVDNFDEKYINPAFDDSSFVSVNIPHANKEIPYNNFDEKMYQFVSCYRKHIVIDKSLKGKKLILEFEAIANAADVYVNGNFAFSHKGSYTAFNGDIADFVKFGEDNVITVRVDSRELEDVPPFGNVIDYLVYGGIYRETYLYVHDDIYAQSLLLAPLDALTDPKINATVRFNDKASCDVTFEVSDKEGKVVASTIVKADGMEVSANLSIKDAALWDVESPNLYTVKASFNKESIEDKCGIRECVFKKNGFFLNGKLLKIRGLNRHQCYPYVGYAMPASVQEADADYLKFDLGVNLARTSHYPNSKHFLNRCDEIGLLVFTEIPGWQFVSQREDWRNLCLQHVEEMITQDFNHPSIILWGVRINESGDDDKLYTKTNALAHSLDSTRQTGGVRCIPMSHLLEDVYTYNDFTHAGGKAIFMPKAIVSGLNKPLLITEHNGHMFPTKSFDHEKKRQEHALRHARVLNAMYGSKGRAGCIGWCMSDYNTHKDFGSGDKICYHGVSDMFRIDKLAASVYKSQQKIKPVLEISSNMEIGDNAGGQVGDVYMFTNCDEVKMYKKGKLVNTFNMDKERAKSAFSNMPVPPVILYDVIGDQLEKDEKYNFKHRDAEQLKKALLGIKKYGTFGGIAHHPYALLKNLIKYRLSIASITDLFGQYVTSWGGEQISYKFEGYMDGKLVIVNEKGSVCETSLYAQADKTQLIEKDTYDAVRVVLKAVSQYGNVLPYDNSVVRITTNDIVEVIGPKDVAMIGGQRGFWIKTKGVSGKAVVTLESETLGKKVLEFDVKKENI